MKKKISLGLILSLISLLVLLAVPHVYATLYSWNLDPDFVNNTITVNSSYWVTNGYWDVKGFQWGDPDTTYPSGFSANWQDDVVAIWVGDWEHDGPWEGIAVGTVRQGSVWDLATAPWYDQTTYQPTPLHFSGKSAVTLSVRVRIDSQDRTALGWINWLFNPWFRVRSTYEGVTKERKMVWDIVWGFNSWLGFSNAQPSIDAAEILHLDFYVEEMAQTGEWKTYSIDLLDMATQAKERAEGDFGWQFEVDDLYLWSIGVPVEGFDYVSQFSVDFLEVVFETPQSSGSGVGCPCVSTWNGSKYVGDNNLIPAAEYSNGSDVTDYNKLQQPLTFGIINGDLSVTYTQSSYIWSAFLVLFINITYIVRRSKLKRSTKE